MKGKEKCEFLKGIRKRMAEANGIPYEPRECTFEGECTGTCPFCEKEAAELMAKLRKKEAEGVEIKTDDFCIEAINIMQREPDSLPDYLLEKLANPDTRAEAYKEWEQYLIEQEKNAEVEQLPGSLMNPYDEDTNIPELPIDPFRGSNNPFMSRKDLDELRQERNNRRSETLMGDIDDEEYWKLKDEELRNKQEEDCTDEEERKGGFSKIIDQIKRVATQGLIEDEE